MDNVIEQIEGIVDRKDLCRFLEGLAADFRKNPGEWETRTIDEFLEAMASWIEDYSSAPNNDIEWDRASYSTFAKILYMGKLYE